MDGSQRLIHSLCVSVSLFIAPAPTCPRPPPPTPPLTPPRPPAPPLTTVWTSALRPRPAAVPDQNLPQPLTTNAPRPWPRCLCTTARWRTRASSGWAWTWVTTTATCTRASWWVYTQNIISYMQNFYLTEEDKNYFTETTSSPPQPTTALNINDTLYTYYFSSVPQQLYNISYKW